MHASVEVRLTVVTPRTAEKLVDVWVTALFLAHLDDRFVKLGD